MKLDEDYQDPYGEDGRPYRRVSNYERRREKKAKERYQVVAFAVITLIILIVGVIAGIVATLLTMNGGK